MKKVTYLFFTFLFVLSVAGLAQKKPVTLETLMKEYKFYPNSVRGVRSMDDGTHYTTLEKRGSKIVKYAYKTGEKKAVLYDLSTHPIEGVASVHEYQFSPDEEKILLMTNRESIYRRSFTAEYYVFDRSDETLEPLSGNGRQEVASFSPSGNKVAFVRDNNLFIKNLDRGEERQITQDGKFNHIINGKPDWVYEEEFEFNQAYEWSPDGEKIAYIKFDESRVKEWNILMYKGLAPEKTKNKLYPELYTYKYPKAGEKNSIVSVHIYDLKSDETTEVDVGPETDQYIPRIRWTQDPEVLSVFRLNRLQNYFEILLADAQTGETEVMYDEKNKYFIDEKYFDDIRYLPDGEHFIIMSEMEGYAQLYLYNTDGERVEKLTKGEYDVTNYIGYNADDKQVYYQAAAKSPLRREVYVVGTDGDNPTQISPATGSNRALFSEGFQYFINYFSSAGKPPHITLHNENGKEIRVLEDNEALKERLGKYKHTEREFFTFETAQGTTLHGWMVKPVDFDASREYPLLMTQYSGPNSQQVRDNWQFGWEQVLANKGYVVACVDGRGTGARGEEFRKMTYKELGKYETVDQIETAKYLGEKPFIDKERIGIYGWSYGGFMSLLCMTKGAEFFDTGVAVAPVTNWRYYDNIYTERFMRKPQNNPEGYDQNSPINHAEKLQGDLLMLHGTADDNVHIQNSLEMAEALVQANKDFTFQPYLNRDHSMYGGNTRYHLFRKIVRFLDEHLKAKE